VSRLPKQHAATVMALISGPAEESVRLLLVLFAVSGFGNLLWARFGWATIEVVYTLVTALAVRRLLLDPSAKAAERRRLLVSMGWLQYVQSLVPALGAVERAGRACSTSALPCCWAGIRGWCWSPCRPTAPPTWPPCG
jgi:hypothetical protein